MECFAWRGASDGDRIYWLDSGVLVVLEYVDEWTSEDVYIPAQAWVEIYDLRLGRRFTYELVWLWPVTE
ncbi:MAG: hypothetical protein HPY90_14245 [Syntrophothermus sp.]|uniref:hypothetical protein n=1 Tax=Syntrophothermus sp. TaxID=2736299 RepID=UPI00257F50FF|nr:hypothetical protein [Syntrophothermus sp.]NSW84397.1 hypothetical protein [Syntrophothermus sp.]